MTEALDKKKKAPQCYSGLKSIEFTTNTTNIPVDPTASIAHLGPQCPQDYANGFLTEYDKMKWSEWRRSFEHQTGVVLKLCIGKQFQQRSEQWCVENGSTGRTVHSWLETAIYLLPRRATSIQGK